MGLYRNARSNLFLIFPPLLTAFTNEERTIWLEHIVPNERKLLGDTKPIAENAQRFRFKLSLAPNATINYVVAEEFLNPRPEVFALKLVEGTPIPRPGTESARR